MSEHYSLFSLRYPYACAAACDGLLTVTLANNLVYALGGHTGRATDVGEGFAGVAGKDHRLPQGVVGLRYIASCALDALQVCLSHIRGVRAHLLGSSWLVEGESHRVLATQETVGSCGPDRQVRSDRPCGRVFRDMAGTTPKSTAGSNATNLVRRAPFIQARRLFGGSLIRSALRAVSGTAGLAGVSMSTWYLSRLEDLRQVDFTNGVTS